MTQLLPTGSIVTFTCLVVVLFAACEVPEPEEEPPVTDEPPAPEEAVPDWAQDAVFYQIFPERFRDGDPGNNPTRQTLERPVDDVPLDWEITPWTSDWYDRADWEEAMSDDFYDAVYSRRYGGDLQGVIDELDYLDSLGVNALYFNPVFWGRSLHKYDGNSFHHVDPHFGPDPEGDKALLATEDPTDPDTWHVTAADSLFFELVDRAHERDMRVVIDGVFNHTGRDFFAFADVRSKREASRFADWYKIESFGDPDDPDAPLEYQGWWDVPSLPEFAHTEDDENLHPEVKQYVFDATERWMAPDGDVDRGVDGWRLDVASDVPVGFWQDWNAHVRSINPEAYTVAEEWEEASDLVEEGGFSAVMNYHAFAFPVKGFLIDRSLAPSEFGTMLEERQEQYPDPTHYALQNLIDSHDTERVASMIVNADEPPYDRPEWFDYDWGEEHSPRYNPDYDVGAPDAAERQLQKLVALFQMTYVGAPMIYYGTEAGMWGGDDPDDRKPMVWPDLEYETETADPLGREREPDPVAFDHDLFDVYQELVHLRRDHDAFRRGDYEVIYTDDELGHFAYSRVHEDEAFVVVINRSDEAHSMRIELPDELRGEYELATAVGDDLYRVQQDATALLLEVSHRSGLVLERTETL